MSEFFDVGQEQRGARDLRIFVVELAEFLAAVVVAVFLFRSFVYQPYSVTGTSMTRTLLPGDRLLGNKFIYGPQIPFTRIRPVSLHEPQPGEVVVFRDPAASDRVSLRRVVALPGMKVRISDKQVFLNGVRFSFPATAEAGDDLMIDGRYSPRDRMPEFQVPVKGEKISFDSLPLFAFDFALSLIRQENPEARLTHTADLFVNHKAANDLPLEDFNSEKRHKDGTLNFDAMDWRELTNVVNFLQAKDDSTACSFKRTLFMDGREVKEYIIRTRCYFLMGDYWDESMDSRYTGFVTEDRILARAAFIYFSRAGGETRWRRMFVTL